MAIQERDRGASIGQSYGRLSVLQRQLFRSLVAAASLESIQSLGEIVDVCAPQYPDDYEVCDWLTQRLDELLQVNQESEQFDDVPF